MNEKRKFACGIIGNPLGHTLSPLLHARAFKHYGLDGTYSVWPVTPEELPAFIEKIRRTPLSGVSVTIPHKEKVIPLLDRLTSEAAFCGAVNTIFWKEGLLWGDNTDLYGFSRSLGEESFGSALLLGSGGAARAVLAALARRGTPEIFICARNLEKAEGLAGRFTSPQSACSALAWEEREKIFAPSGGVSQNLLVVNCTPLGMAGAAEEESPLPPGVWRQAETAGLITAFDLVYNPPLTRFLREAAEAGRRTAGGLGMLAAQAARQFALWTGLEPDIDMFKEVLTNATTA